MEKIRLSKLMSEQGFCSRREADQYIARGWVSVDGEPVSELGTKIYPTQKIQLNNAAQIQQQRCITILLNKPIGYVSGQPEPGYLPAISLINRQSQFFDKKFPQRFSQAHLKKLAPAGRLDIDSQGLLVLTQDGRIAKQLIGTGSNIEKEYLVRIEGSLPSEKLALLNYGLSLDGQALKHAQVSWQNKDQLRFILKEGKKRQIRRMCELVAVKVTGLKRVRIGNVKLANLPEGKWRYLQENVKF
jgi:23S rRNA pseudouridine2604 synthase